MTFSSARSKAQSAFEFIFIFGILLAALLVGTAVFSSKLVEVGKHQTRLEVDTVLDSVAGKIDTAWLEGSGFSTNVTLPATISGQSYELNRSSNYIFLTLNQVEYTRSIITKNVTGTFTPGAVNRLSNLGDRIEIS